MAKPRPVPGSEAAFGRGSSPAPGEERGFVHLLLAGILWVGGADSLFAQPTDECVSIDQLTLTCDTSVDPPTYALSFTATNLALPVAEHLFLIPTTTHTFDPEAFDLSALTPGDSVSITTSVGGATAGETLCFLVTLHDDTLGECCVSEACADVPGCGAIRFVRGDCNADGGYDIADAIAGLGILFGGGGPAPCEDACDANDDGTFDIADMIYILASLFALGPAPPSPHPGCGTDPTADPLTCVSFPPCP